MLNISITLFERNGSVIFLDDLKCVLSDLVQTVKLLKQRAPSHAMKLVSPEILLPHELLSNLEKAENNESFSLFSNIRLSFAIGLPYIFYRMYLKHLKH